MGRRHQRAILSVPRRCDEVAVAQPRFLRAMHNHSPTLFQRQQLRCEDPEGHAVFFHDEFSSSPGGDGLRSRHAGELRPRRVH